MALYVPSTVVNVERTIRRHVKKVLDSLDDSYTIGSQLIPEIAVSSFVIEGPDRRWLPVSVFKSPPQVISDDSVKTIVKELKEAFPDAPEIQFLVVIWSDNDLNTSQLPLLEQRQSIATVCGRKQFSEDLPNLFASLSSPHAEDSYHWLKARFFPESKIPLACTTRILGNRDSSAHLDQFFLDYDQELASKLDILEQEEDKDASEELNIRLINGVAGSGKTLILINRALLYCRKYPEKKTLLLIHNKPVTLDVKHRVDEYWQGIPDNLAISTFHAWGLSQRKQSISWVKPVFDHCEQAIDELKTTRKDHPSIKINDSNLLDELTFINDNLINSEEEYISASRQGRGFSLRGSEKSEIWKIYEKFSAIFSDTKKGYLASLYIKEMCSEEKTWPLLEKYDHILIDEAQFFAPSWFQLVKLSLKDDGQIFMCADPNQGFLKSRLSWKRVGLDVRGKTKNLYYSYRTTKPILEAAYKFLTSMIQEDPADYLSPDYSNMTDGSKPLIIYSSTQQDAVDRLINEVIYCVEKSNVPLNQIMIIHTKSISPWAIKKRIQERVGNDSVWCFYEKKKTLEPGKSYIKLVQLESATGLEAGVTFIIGLERMLDESNSLDLSEDERKEAQTEMCRKLYMAMTRAGQKLVMFSTSKLPESLESLVLTEGSCD
ncbi:DNA helicase [Hahella sp. KA22]|uniref:UvrD-helicase domain-containing protein n=1 Tax=Hahella sp. KA22 TaxID=1628392 RepID=UPI000FDDC7A2|nr:UvrD-helicase domain-containing protein [Hahella sp. KA22]AZZ92135.1 DNA helicase [Hahella sp. KA22]QAY55506.1 DNA helicase [Hahella sp. KA22]